MLEVQIQKKLVSAIGKLILDLSFEMQSGERLAIVGASGSGKTTILRMLAGLLTPDSGNIYWNKQAWFDQAKNINLPPQKRNAGLLFQEYALFPNQTVRQNLEYALKKGQSKSIVEELLQVMELEGVALRLPQMLSGGQQQRVALARALVAQPSLLLLDEPLSALDAPMREKLQDYILKLHKQYQLTIIWVTHNLEEVAKIAHRVLLLENGKLVEQPLKTKPEGISGVVESIQWKENQQVVRIFLDSEEALSVGKKVIIHSKDEDDVKSAEELRH